MTYRTYAPFEVRDLGRWSLDAICTYLDKRGVLRRKRIGQGYLCQRTHKKLALTRLSY